VIRSHEFNGSWWGAKVGIVQDSRFFDQAEPLRRSALAPYRWAEFRCPLAQAPDPWRLAEAGFVQADTQLRFRIALQRLAPGPESDADLTVRFANQQPFEIPAHDWPDFPHERFRHLPGATAETVAQRYALWGSALLAQSPEWCVEMQRDGEPQGWFLAESEGSHLHLALAMLRVGATVSGLDLYLAALRAFAGRGARLGEARFSIENRSVHNIYSRLGAVFLESIGCWLWRAP
jgi:hypothetical protein